MSLDFLSQPLRFFKSHSFQIQAHIHLVFPISVFFLLDSGATACFIDIVFAKSHSIPFIMLSQPLKVDVVDGRPISSGLVTHCTIPILFQINNHQESISFFVISTPSNPVILGLSWLRFHNPHIDWHNETIDFSDPICLNHLPPVSATSASASASESSPAIYLSASVSPPGVLLPSAETSGPDPAAPDCAPPIRICFLGAKPFLQAAEGQQVYSIITTPVSDSKPLGTILPTKYSTFQDVFDKAQGTSLPEHRPYDCTIDLLPGTNPPWGPIYGLSEPETKVLKEYIQEHLANGFIRHSKSSAGAPVFFVKKKDGSLRLCVDYQGLNRISTKNRYPLPLISSLLTQLASAKVYTKIDLRGAYNLVRIRPGDEWKTAFRTRYGLFEYTVMPFGLSNAPAVFQHMMNDIFRDLLDQFVVIYVDDILIYSSTQEEHNQHVKIVLDQLRKFHLFAKLEKCSFDQDQVEFLGYMVTPHGVHMDSRKVDTLLSWATPKSVHDIQSFLGFANFYRIFIKGFSLVTAPLVSLTCKDKKPFAWNSNAQSSFEALKQAFTSAPILAHVDPSQPFILETDASDFALGAVLSQYQDDGLLHPVAFYSCKFSPAEINYNVYDKELLAIVTAFEQWRHYLDGAQHTITIFCDHRNLQYFTSSRVLNCRQARWSLFLADFDFVITYRPGIEQGKSDALSRRSEYQPQEGDETFLQQKATLLKPHHLKLNSIIETPTDPSLLNHIKEQILSDALAQDVISHLGAQPPDAPGLRTDYEQFSFSDGLLLRNGLVYVPDIPSRLDILQSRHDSLLAGHFGISKTFELVSRDYWWPQLRVFIQDYIKSCDICCRSKAVRHKPYGPLLPLPVPNRSWQSISMDFITDLPLSNGHDSILVIVDRLTKMAHFVPCSKTITSEQTASLVLQNIVCLHGLPDDIVSDRGPQFASRFWSRLFTLLGTNTKLSSAFHPQTDGQSERVNQVLEQYLCCVIDYNQDNWNDLLPTAEFAYNNTVHSSTKTSPFYANYGFHPRFEFKHSASSKVPAAEDHVAKMQDIITSLITDIKHAQDSYKANADCHRMEAPELGPGDKVWLLQRNVKTL